MTSNTLFFDPTNKRMGDAEGPTGLDLSVGETLEVVACAPSPWDLAPQSEPPRAYIPGNVIVGRSPQSGEIYCCGGFLPCGLCERCETGLHLACLYPQRPGWNRPGGLASTITLPPQFLVPCTKQADDWASVVALISLAGPLYQAQAQNGMTPGDYVLVLGDLGPGALPLRILSFSGLHPIWISSRESELPEGVEQITTSAEFSKLPVTRRHLICLPQPDPSIDWPSIVASCLTCTFIGPSPPPHFPFLTLLDGQVCLRWIKDLHPHLILDMIELSKRILVKPWWEPFNLAQFPQAFIALLDEETPKWPVLIP